MLLLAFATISRTMVMTTSHLLSSGSVRIFVPKVCQSFSLRDGFINSSDLSAFLLRPGPILQPIYEVEQYIFIRDVRNMKREGGELFHLRPNTSLLVQFPKLTLDLVDDVIREEGFLEIFTESLLSVDVHVPFPISDSLRLHHNMAISERYKKVVLILLLSLFTRLHLK